MRYFFHWLPIAIILFFPLPTAAAPQILLSVGSERAISMRCENDHCEAEIGTICLQPDRSGPASGTPYAPLERNALEVVAEGREGQLVKTPLARELHIVAARGHTAIRLTIRREFLLRRGLDQPALLLSRNAIFVPAPTEGDDEPQSESDTAFARTTLRTIAANVIHRQTDRSQAAAVILRAINSLPRERPPTLAEQAVTEANMLNATMPENVSILVHEAAGYCQGLGTTFIEQEPLFSYRGCLAVNHDTLLEELNMDYRVKLKGAPWG